MYIKMHTRIGIPYILHRKSSERTDSLQLTLVTHGDGSEIQVCDQEVTLDYLFFQWNTSVLKLFFFFFLQNMFSYIIKNKPKKRYKKRELKIKVKEYDMLISGEKIWYWINHSSSNRTTYICLLAVYLKQKQESFYWDLKTSVQQVIDGGKLMGLAISCAGFQGDGLTLCTCLWGSEWGIAFWHTNLLSSGCIDVIPLQ